MLSSDQLRQLLRTQDMPRFAEKLASAARKYMPQYGITDPKDVAAFWAMIAVETAGLRSLEENLNYSAKRLCVVWPKRFRSIQSARPFARNPEALANRVYGLRGGNKGRKGAGWLYRGSGPLQTTFYNNFLEVEQNTGVPVTKQPDRLRKDPDLGMRAACIFWKKNNVGKFARMGDLKRARKRVNGGLHGLARISTLYQRALLILKDGRHQSSKSPRNTSKILPEHRPQQSAEITRKILTHHAILLPQERRKDPVQLLFVRGYFLNSMGKQGKNDRGTYDDAVFIVTPDAVFAFNANSDPSRHRPRIATIKADQAIRYRPGLHGYQRRGGPYPAFRQDEACFIERDNTGQSHGIFHVNLHRGARTSTSSEGCLTIPPSQWTEFYGLLSRQLQAYQQKTFYVTLLEYAGGRPPIPTAPGTKSMISILAGAFILSLVGWIDSLKTWIKDLLSWIF